MKYVFYALVLAASFPAAATTPEQMSSCALKSDLYASAAQLRDQNQSPQDAAKILGAYKGQYVSDADFKHIINTVYFDQRFANAGGMALKKQMLDFCLNGPKRYEPLQ